MFKWGLVVAGLADINRPIEEVSLFQSIGKKIDKIFFPSYNLSAGVDWLDLGSLFYANHSNQL